MGVSLHCNSLVSVIGTEIFVHFVNRKGLSLLVVTVEPESRSLVELVVSYIQIVSASLQYLPPFGFLRTKKALSLA